MIIAKHAKHNPSSAFPVSFKRFRCLQCGKCCTMTVKPSEHDIRKIEALGYKRMHFLRDGSLKKIKGVCCFLERKDNRFYCTIHEMKPALCRKYPFTVLGRDRLFSCPGLKP